MEISFQIIIDTISNCFVLAFPFALIFWIVERITTFFLSLVNGNEVKI